MARTTTPTFLTPRQIQVLRLRAGGHTQEKIAEMLGTSRENITNIEKKARANIEKARYTIELYESLNPIRMTVKPGTDIFDIPRQVFKKADSHGVKVLHNSTSLVGLIRKDAGASVAGNRVVDFIALAILRNGRVRILSPGKTGKKSL